MAKWGYACYNLRTRVPYVNIHSSQNVAFERYNVASCRPSGFEKNVPTFNLDDS